MAADETAKARQGGSSEEQEGSSREKKQQPVKRPMRKIKFMNNEDPSADLAFTFVTKDGQPERYRFFPGFEYEVPADVVRHLNSLAFPVYQEEIDQITGQTTHKQVGSFNRFSCHPVE